MFPFFSWKLKKSLWSMFFFWELGRKGSPSSWPFHVVCPGMSKASLPPCLHSLRLNGKHLPASAVCPVWFNPVQLFPSYRSHLLQRPERSLAPRPPFKRWGRAAAENKDKSAWECVSHPHVQRFPFPLARTRLICQKKRLPRWCCASSAFKKLEKKPQEV